MTQIEVFINNWKLVGIVGLAVMLFFSSLAFTVLENAMSVIFHHRVRIQPRATRPGQRMSGKTRRPPNGGQP